jgi:hypothetical protein
MAKVEASLPRKAATTPRKLTLAHLTVSWETRLDTRRVDGGC